MIITYLANYGKKQVSKQRITFRCIQKRKVVNRQILKVTSATKR